MKEFTAQEHYYVIVLLDQQGIAHYWAKEKDFYLTDITHATRFDNITVAKGVITKARKKYKECPWFRIKETDPMFIAEVHAVANVKELKV